MNFYEYQEISSESLSKHIINNKLLHKYFSQDWEKIKAGQYCGILNYENIDYYILPKISKEDDKNLDIFIYMLRYVYDIKIDNEDIASSKNIKSNHY